MPPYRLQAKTLGLSGLFIFCLSGSLLTAVAQENPLAGRDIAPTIVRDNGRSLVLVVQKTVVKPGTNIKQLLKGNGIYPDADAFGLIYDLNPKLERLDPIAPGTELLLPKVQSSGPAPALPAGFLIALTVDKGLKDELLTKLDALNNVAAKATRFTDARFNDEEDRRTVLASIATLNQSLEVLANVIAGKARPVSSEMLNQIKAEVEMLQPTLDGLARSEQKLSDSDREVIKLVADDLQIKQKTFGEVRADGQPPTRWSEVQVVVRTLKTDDGSAVANLTIYYVPEALFGKGNFQRSFNRLSSPTDQTLPEANYRIWATRAGDTRPVTEVKRIEVRKRSASEPLTVELPVIN
jgi:hypothetical protein